MRQNSLNEAPYKKLIVWQNARILRKKIYDITRGFSKSEYRRVSQMNDAARSVKQNIQEGYGQTLPKYINALRNIAKPSLSELRGDIDDCYEDNLISESEFKDLDSLCCKTDYLFMKLIRSLENRRKEQK